MDFFDQLEYHVIAFVIDLIAAILLLRTYTGTRNSRFLVHLSIAFGIIGVTHILDAGISTLNLFSALPANEAMLPTPSQLKGFEERIDLLMSCLSTFFFILASLLLWSYPNQNISPNAFALAAGIIGAFVALVTVIQGPPDDSIFLKTIDILTSVGATLAVGVGLVRLALGHKSIITAWIASACYVLWAGAQTLYWVNYKNWALHPYYFYSLTITGLVAAIATIIFCALTLPDRTMPEQALS